MPRALLLQRHLLIMQFIILGNLDWEALSKSCSGD